MQTNAVSSSNYLSGEWYKLSNGNCSCCEGAYSSEYGERKYIQGGGCAIVALVSAIYNPGGTINDSEIYDAVDSVFDWAYQKGYWAYGLKSNTFFTESDENFGDLYGYSISSTYSVTDTDTRLKEHIQNGGTAVVHVYGHYMVIVDYRIQDGVEQFRVFDPAPGSGTYWNSSNRRSITSAGGDWFSIADLKNNGGNKGSKGSKENIEIDAFWLVSAK